MNFSHRVFFNNCSFDLWALNKTTYQIVKLLSKGAMLKKTKVDEKVLVGVHQNSEKETFSSFGLTHFSILFSVFREVEPCGTTLKSMKNHPGSQTTKKVRKQQQKFTSSRCSLCGAGKALGSEIATTILGPYVGPLLGPFLGPFFILFIENSADFEKYLT